MKTDKLPMRGRHKASKLVKLARAIDRPEYFQHLVNKLETENTEDGQSNEEVEQQLPVVKEVSQSKVKRRKAITKKGLLD